MSVHSDLRDLVIFLFDKYNANKMVLSNYVYRRVNKKDLVSVMKHRVSITMSNSNDRILYLERNRVPFLQCESIVNDIDGADLCGAWLKEYIIAISNEIKLGNYKLWNSSGEQVLP